MSHRRDQRDHARGCRAHHDLLAERLQILERAAAARDDEQVGSAHRAIDGKRVEAVDGGGDLLGAAIALHAHRPYHHVAREAVGEPMQNIANDGARGRGDDSDPLGQERQELLARGVEQTFCGELLLARLYQRHQRADAGQLERLDDDLVGRLPGEGGQPAGDHDLEPFLGLDAHAPGRAPPDYRLDLGVRVLEGEIAVAGGVRAAEAGDFPAHPHVGEGVFHGPPQRRRELGDGPFADIQARRLVHGEVVNQLIPAASTRLSQRWGAWVSRRAWRRIARPRRARAR
jgi:hypothetical protein